MGKVEQESKIQQVEGALSKFENPVHQSVEQPAASGAYLTDFPDNDDAHML